MDCRFASGTLAQIAIDNPNQVAAIEMHVKMGYSLFSQEAYDRMSYYEGTSGPGVYVKPWLWYDGKNGGMLYFLWESMITSRIAQPAPVTITMWGDYSPQRGSGTVYANFQNDSSASINGRVFFVVTEDSIYEVTPTGDEWHNHVARDYVPDQSGEVISIEPGNNVTLSRAFTIDQAWDDSRCQIVTWIQNDSMYADSTKEIWQGDFIYVDQLSGIEEITDEQTSGPQILTAPNPCIEETNFRFNLPAGMRYSIRVFDILGRDIKEFSNVSKGGFESVKWDLRDKDGLEVSAGIYVYRFENSIQTKTGKILVR